jgi:ATP-dependent DNA ligase
VAKRISGRYRCGQRTNAWIKLKSPAAIERDRRRMAAALRWAA